MITGYALKRDFADARSLDLLLSYEKRIESSLYKATAEFRKTQKLRKEKQTQYGEEYRTHNTGDRMNLVSSEDYLSGRNQMEPDAVINKANLDEDAEHRMPETAETKSEDEFVEQSQFASARQDGERGRIRNS